MDRIKIYKPPDGPAQAAEFIEGLEPKLRDKLVRQIFYLSQTPLSELKEPHYKHFSIEKYQSLYELREKGRVVVRVIFTPCPNGDYLLLHAFVKRQKRDTEKALEHSLRLMSLSWEWGENKVKKDVKRG
ncbi:type II toxin-antitoxin system RelE/ParE family toxin [Oscillospiraceae bacterium 50-16]